MQCCVIITLATTDNDRRSIVGSVTCVSGTATTLFALFTDVTPTDKVGRVTSFGAFCGNIGGMGIVWAAGKVLTMGLGYGPLLVFAGSSYLLALAWIQLWLPKITPLADRQPAPVSLGH